jgi:hypothetical protein
MRCSECGHEYAEEPGGCQWCGAAGLPGAPYLEFLPLRGLGALLTVLVALTTEVIAAQLMLRAYGAASGQPWASRLSSRVGDAGDAAYVFTGIVFVAWFRRARINAENSSWRQRRASGWTFWGWIIPIANLFVPFQLMGDIWRAGLPAARRNKTAWLPTLWWIAFLLSGIYISNGSSQSGGPSGHDLILPGDLQLQLVRSGDIGRARDPSDPYGQRRAGRRARRPSQPRTRRKTPSVVAAARRPAGPGRVGRRRGCHRRRHLPCRYRASEYRAPGPGRADPRLLRGLRRLRQRHWLPAAASRRTVGARRSQHSRRGHLSPWEGAADRSRPVICPRALLRHPRARAHAVHPAHRIQRPRVHRAVRRRAARASQLDRGGRHLGSGVVRLAGRVRLLPDMARQVRLVTPVTPGRRCRRRTPAGRRLAWS